MLIPSIDLKNGKVVQLVQGERLAIESEDLDGWVGRFARFPKVQLIDLDAAIGSEFHAPVPKSESIRIRASANAGKNLFRFDDLIFSINSE